MKGNKPKSAPCARRGRELTGAEREARELSHARNWLFCESPRRVELRLAEVVCRCRCNARCPGYQSGEPAPPP